MNQRIAIVGAGSVGATIAYACLVRGVGGQVVLYDIARAKVDAEVLDLNHGIQFTGSHLVEGSDDPGICKDAAVVVITLLLAVPAAWALARLTGAWGQQLGIGIFLTYLVPPTLLFIPMSRVVSYLGLQDTLWAVIVTYPTFTVPFSIWLLMGFFKAIPRDLEDAALVDGLTRFGAFVKLVIPISVSGILTVVIFSFTLVTQEFVYALTFISSAEHQTVGVGVPIFLVRGDVYYWGSLMAACLITSLPIAVVYNLFLDRFIAGFTVGAVK